MDIIERLRRNEPCEQDLEAADEIERLRDELSTLRKKIEEAEPVAWSLPFRLYFKLADAEWDLRHDEAFKNTGYTPKPIYTLEGIKE